MNSDIIELLIHNFEDEKTLTQVREDYEDLELLIERERSTNGVDSRRLAALNVLAQFLGAQSAIEAKRNRVDVFE